MRDLDVRRAVLEHLAAQHGCDDDTRVVEEMGIWSGSVRIDIAVINGSLTGYELKSDSDTLARLPAQAALYSRVFDNVFLVVGSKHVGKARRIVPRWWGVIEASPTTAGVRLKQVRECKPNPSPDALLIARLLWRDEALAILDDFGLASGWRSKPAPQIHGRLASELSFEQLSTAVRTTLKERVGWLGKPISNYGQVPVNADLNPSLAAPWGRLAADAENLLDAGVTPANWQPAERG